MNSELNIPIIYVWLGSSIPEYAKYSLNSAQERSGLPIILLSNGERPFGINSEISWFSIDEFYDGKSFSNFRLNSPMDPEFRNGFWFSVSERFFVLNEFVTQNNLDSFFHAELDVLIFNLVGLSNKLNNIGNGLFIPRDRVDKFIASLIYINSPTSLSKFCEFLICNAHIGIEMYILSDFSDQYPSDVFALPSGPSMLLGNASTDWHSISPNQIGGIVDAADFGRFLFGHDPRNSTQIVKNRYLDEFGGRDSSDSEYLPPIFTNKLFLERETSSLQYQDGTGKWRFIFAIHVHSKQFRRLRSDRHIVRFVRKHNANKVVVISHNYPARIKQKLKSYSFITKTRRLILNFSRNKN